MLSRNAFQIELGEYNQGCARRRHAADREHTDQNPIHRSCGRVNDCTGHLGRGGKQEVGADRCCRMDAEQQYEKRRH